MSQLTGNLLVGQSGGPTAVINASVCGVVQEAFKHSCIEGIYGGMNGILGMLNEEIFDFRKEDPAVVDGLKFTPAAGLGTCRYKLDFKKKAERAAKDMDRLFEVFQAHNIRYFFYAGGNDSQDSSHKIHLESVKRGWEMRVIGVPKTIDNDLPHTDHTPGYGSVIKYVCSTVMEVGLDVGSMATDDGSCCIIEVMGRSAGWIAAGSALAQRGNPDNPPQIILLPEVPFDRVKFIEKVKSVVAKNKYCIVICGEGIKYPDGREVGADYTKLDDFGHPALAGASTKLKEIVEKDLNLKTRTVLLGYAQRAAAHYGSATDAEESHACGVAATKAAVSGISGQMVKIVRESSNPYKWTTGLQPLGDIANVEHFLPKDWIAADGLGVNEKFIEYAAPLIVGQTKVPEVNGLPGYAILAKYKIAKKLPPRG